MAARRDLEINMRRRRPSIHYRVGLLHGCGVARADARVLMLRYVCAGVMRFLQLEWHNHERARNAWDIERAEMKAKIAKQEGECRHARRINEQLDKQTRMLELALKREREKNRANGQPATPAGASGAPTAAETEAKGDPPGSESRGEESRLGSGPDSLARPAQKLPRTSQLDLGESTDSHEKTREQNLDKTTKYLKDCMNEIQYLLSPAQSFPPLQSLPNGNYTGLLDPPLPIDDVYMQNQEQQRHLRQSGRAPMQPQPPTDPPSSAIPNIVTPMQPDMARNARYGDSADSNRGPPESLREAAHQTSMAFEDSAESITHTFDSRGQAVPTTELQPGTRSTRSQADPDGWTFDDEPSGQPDRPAAEMGPPRRPDTDLFPSAANTSPLSSGRTTSLSHRRKSSGSQAMSRRRSSQGKQEALNAAHAEAAADPYQFKVKFALRGHLDVVRSVIFSGGGSPSEPEICTAGDDGTIKRWIVPASYQNFNTPHNSQDLDIPAYFTHRGHDGIVTCLATCPASTGFSTGGRANGDGWIFSGGQDATIRVWERGRVDPKDTLDGHTDAVWCVCVLPASVGVVFGPQSGKYGGPDRLLLASGSADGTVKVWAVSAPPQTSSSSTGSRRGVGGSRRHSVTSGSNFPSSPQPSVASNTPFSYTLVHSIERSVVDGAKASPTSICHLSPSGETFVVSYTDSSVLVFDTRTGEELVGMASNETYDGTINTSINAVVALSKGLEGAGTNAIDAARGLEADEVSAGATGSREVVEGATVITGHEDRFVRFFDANSGTFPRSTPHRTHMRSSLTLPPRARRPMHLHHARPPVGHFGAVALQRRPRGRVGRPRRQHPLLEPGKTYLHAGYCVAPRNARRGRLRRRLEPGRPLGRERRRRWRGQGLCALRRAPSVGMPRVLRAC